jgi:hypothetical protein
MELLSRHRQQLRRAAMTAALGALLVPATAGAASKKTPTITKVSPKSLTIGDTMTVTGKYFLRGKAKNTVLFRASNGAQLFVKADVSTTRRLYVVVPDTLVKYLSARNGVKVATTFRLRILSGRLGKAFTTARLSPKIAPKPAPPAPPAAPTPTQVAQADPNGDADGDGLSNTLEANTLKTDPSNADTDGDGVGDGFEYQSAIDLNNDDYHHPSVSIPFPGKRPYPNPLDGSDAGTDYDGDSLTLLQEYQLWQYTVKHENADPSLDHLTYSDGLQYSIYTRDPATGKRIPALPANGYDKQTDFLNWLASSGYGTVYYPDQPNTPYDLLDVNRNGTVDAGPRIGYAHSEVGYLDTHGPGASATPDGFLSDDERDEDADGLSNFTETRGEISDGWFDARYPTETPFPVKYADTKIDDPDSDGDGIRDGADDQDHDDVPNIDELSRNMVTGRPFDNPKTDYAHSDPSQPEGRVNPYNPCLPFKYSRTCPSYIPFSGAWAPFDGPANQGDDPDYLVLN